MPVYQKTKKHPKPTNDHVDKIDISNADIAPLELVAFAELVAEVLAPAGFVVVTVEAAEVDAEVDAEVGAEVGAEFDVEVG